MLKLFLLRKVEPRLWTLCTQASRIAQRLYIRLLFVASGPLKTVRKYNQQSAVPGY